MILRVASLALIVCLAQAHRISSTASSEKSSGGVSGSDASDDAPGGTPETPPPAVCPAGGPIGAVALRVRPPKQSDHPLALRTINHLSEGDTVLYAPVLRGDEKRPGEVSLVMVPEKRQSGADSLIVTDPKPANRPQEWRASQTISLVAFVYGPEGLSKKKVKGFLAKDDLLVAQLADYAEKTAETEGLLQALSAADSSSASMNAAVTGFASQYGLSVAIDKTAPPSVQAQTLFATLNPQLATYDPVAPSASSRIGQTASLTTAAAGLFFGNPVGLAAGGAAMLLDLRAIAFPGIQFRSSFAQPVKDSLNLCGQRNPAPPHTRVAYIWANRIPNTPAPAILIQKANYIPDGQKTPLPVQVPPIAWRYLDRAREWNLENSDGKKTAVKVLRLANQKSLEIDLTRTSVAPGEYHLTGYWDWNRFQAAGEIHVRVLSDFERSHLDPASQDRLVAKAGKTVAVLQGGDFEFTDKVELKKVGDEFAKAESVPFLLPQGLREGLQDRMDVQINTADLDPGEYQLLISQQDGKSHPLNFNVLPNPPKIENLPILANEGVTAQHYVLKGERLGLLTKLESSGAVFELEPPSADGSERSLTVQLKSDPKPGATYPLTAYSVNRTQPQIIPDALTITGPLPMVASSKLSLPSGFAITINPGEFPAGGTLSAMLDVKNIAATSLLRLACAQGVGPSRVLHIGEQTDKSSLQQLSPDQLFVSFDTGELPAGCSVHAVIDNGTGGQSQPYNLAHIIRLPQIEQFMPALEQAPEGKHTYTLTGRNLEMIEQVGWDQFSGNGVSELPIPIPGQGQKQSMRVFLPDPPAPTSVLYVWLRGEKTGRATTVTNGLK